METLKILGIFLGSCFIVFLLIFFWEIFIKDFLHDIFTPKVEKIKGKIIKLKEETSTFPFPDEYNQFQTMDVLIHYVELKDETGEEYSIPLPLEHFEELKKQEKMLKNKKIVLYFKKYLFRICYDRYEVEIETV